MARDISIDVSFNPDGNSIKQLKTELQNSLSSISVGFSVSPNSVTAMVNGLQSLLNQQSVDVSYG